MPITVTCAYCGKETKRSPSHVRNPGRSFCNYQCMGNFQHSKRKPQIVYCATCGKPIERSVSHIRRRQRCFCSKTCFYVYKARLSPVSLSPTEALGYLCGWVMGDGSISNNRGNYAIRLKTTKIETAKQFEWAILQAFAKIKVHWFIGTESRVPPGGINPTNYLNKKFYAVTIYSKLFYDWLSPFKKADYIWEVPSFLTTPEAKRGFLSGIFDAEGSTGRGIISLTQKPKTNLQQITNLLREFGITITNIYPSKRAYQLQICSYDEREKFHRLIGFKLLYKKNALQNKLDSKPKVLICQMCGKLFIPKDWWKQKYCLDCRKIAEANSKKKYKILHRRLAYATG